MNGDGTPQLDDHGRQKTWTQRKGIKIDESRLNSYVVPPGLAETHVSAAQGTAAHAKLDWRSDLISSFALVASQLKPYVFTSTASGEEANKGAVPYTVSGYASGDNLMKRAKVFTDGQGLQPQAYKELRQQILSRREQHEETVQESRRLTS